MYVVLTREDKDFSLVCVLFELWSIYAEKEPGAFRAASAFLYNPVTPAYHFAQLLE